MGCHNTTDDLDYPNYVAALGADHPDLAAELAGFQGIEQVLDWMKRRGLCHTSIDIIGQDEFHYDFLLELSPGGEWLAFGVT
jgi:hypothetical protein